MLLLLFNQLWPLISLFIIHLNLSPSLLFCMFIQISKCTKTLFYRQSYQLCFGIWHTCVLSHIIVFPVLDPKPYPNPPPLAESIAIGLINHNNYCLKLKSQKVFVISNSTLSPYPISPPFIPESPLHLLSFILSADAIPLAIVNFHFSSQISCYVHWHCCCCCPHHIYYQLLSIIISSLVCTSIFI